MCVSVRAYLRRAHVVADPGAQAAPLQREAAGGVDREVCVPTTNDAGVVPGRPAVVHEGPPVSPGVWVSRLDAPISPPLSARSPCRRPHHTVVLVADTRFSGCFCVGASDRDFAVRVGTAGAAVRDWVQPWAAVPPPTHTHVHTCTQLFAMALAQAYPRACREWIAGVGSDLDSVFSISVHALTVPAVVRRMLRHSNLVGSILSGLNVRAAGAQPSGACALHPLRVGAPARGRGCVRLRALCAPCLLCETFALRKTCVFVRDVCTAQNLCIWARRCVHCAKLVYLCETVCSLRKTCVFGRDGVFTAQNLCICARRVHCAKLVYLCETCALRGVGALCETCAPCAQC